jgi:hypothetical protein
MHMIGLAHERTRLLPQAREESAALAAVFGRTLALRDRLFDLVRFHAPALLEEFLAENPQAVGCKDRAQRPVLMVARDLAKVRILLRRGAGPNDFNTPFRITPLMAQLMRRNDRMRAGKDVSEEDDQILLELLAAGADPFQSDRRGRNAFTHAKSYDDTRAFEFFSQKMRRLAASSSPA